MTTLEYAIHESDRTDPRATAAVVHFIARHLFIDGDREDQRAKHERSLEQIMAASNTRTYALHIGDQLAAAAVVIGSVSGEGNDFLGHLVVHPGLRRGGIGSHLLAFAEKASLDAGAKGMDMYAFLEAVDFFESQGYRNPDIAPESQSTPRDRFALEHLTRSFDPPAIAT